MAGVWRWTLDHLLLRNVLRPTANAPVADILKVALVSVAVPLANLCTKNPDTLSSVFVSYLCISPLTRAGLMVGAWNVFFSNFVGTLIGTFVTAILYEPPDADSTLMFLKIPIAVSTTLYGLMVLNRCSPGDISGGLFSALFIQVKVFEYEPIEQFIEDMPRHEVISTLAVRLIALTTAVSCASLVNFVVSGSAAVRIFKSRLFFTERLIRKAFRDLGVPPTAFLPQESFRQTVGLIEDVRKAKKEWISQQSKRILRRIKCRAEALLRLLNLQITFCLLSREADLTHEEGEALALLLQYSHCPMPLGAHIDVVDLPELTLPGLKELLISGKLPPSVLLLGRILHSTLLDLEQASVSYQRTPHPLWWDCRVCHLLPTCGT